MNCPLQSSPMQKPQTHSPFYQVQPRRSLDDPAHLAWLECKGDLFELFLHVAVTEESTLSEQRQHNTRPVRVRISVSSKFRDWHNSSCPFLKALEMNASRAMGDREAIHSQIPFLLRAAAIRLRRSQFPKRSLPAS